MTRRLLPVLIFLLLISVSCSGSPASSTAEGRNVSQEPSSPLTVSTPEPTSTPAPVTVQVNPDGSGQYPTIGQAIESIPAGSTILLAEGTYDVSPMLEIHKSVILQGAGKDKTILTSSGNGSMNIQNAAEISLTGITFQYTGLTPSDVVHITGGAITITDCKFTGGVFQDPETGPSVGAGLVVRGTTSGKISNSTFTTNGFIGLIVVEDSTLNLESNSFDHNNSAGLGVGGNYRGRITSNTISDNGAQGINVAGDAAPEIDSNIIFNNTNSGIVFFGNTAGSVRSNDINANGKNGITVNDSSHPLIDNNFTHGNGEAGINVSGTSTSVVQNNISSGNMTAGILVNGNGTPTLQGNTCNENSSDGIVLSGASMALVSGNTAEKNSRVGIGFYESASGSVSENICAFNGWGIYIESGTSPSLGNNNCHDNSTADILDRR